MFKPYGIITALVTPLDKNGNLMEDSLRKVIDYTIAGGVHGVFVLGSTGEFYGLEWEQKKRAIEITVDQAAGRVPVYVGASEIATRDCIRLANLAESYNVSAISVLTPFFITPSKIELKEHYLKIASSTKLPIILYGNDDRTNVSIPPDLAAELSNVENIVGIKDSSGDMTKMGEYIRLTKGREFNVIAGRDTMILANLVYGGAGAIAMTANIVPSIVVGIYDSFKSNDIEKAREYQYKLAPLRISIGLGSFPVVMKEALKLVGIDAGVTLSPIGPITDENRKKLTIILKELGVYQLFK